MMVKVFSLMLLIFLTCNFVQAQFVSSYVDLFICTAGDHGQLDPAATVPFGMVKLGPDTDPVNHSGYDYNATKMKGFSHNRIGGVGCTGAGGNLRFLPSIGEISSQSVPFLKESEKAVPCYYSVAFPNKIVAELTATNQTGFHRYTFPESDCAFVMVDLESSFAGTISFSKKALNENEFFAEVSARNVCGNGRYTVYYHIWCNKSLSDFTVQEGKTFFKFTTRNDEVILFQVTASPVSSEDARNEWKSVTKKLTFEQVRKAGLEKWENLLSRISVEGNEEYKSIFYTHLYHQFLNPVRSENRNKTFRATNGEISKSRGYHHYDCWSMWDNFRNKFSLYPLIVPEYASDFANSLVDLYKFGMPYKSGFYEPVPTVRTEHTIITLLDFYKRGITDFDINAAYQMFSAEINNIQNKTPDKKLEQSYDFWAMAEFAKILGKQEDYNLFMKKAYEYRQIWKDKFLLMGDQSDVMHGDGIYEGTLWQYRWHVQFDIPGIIEMMGGKQEYTRQLEFFFENNLYNHGNQPDIHVPFMFNFGTQPWLTQKWVNMILTKEMIQHYGTHDKWEVPYRGRVYKKAPEGYIPEMDDDEGTMSGWYVLASMGLYPVLVGDPVFQISTPIFEKITIHLPGGKTFIIKTNGIDDKNFYIQSASLNGSPYNQSFIKHEDIISGGILEFNVSDQPNRNWGVL